MSKLAIYLLGTFQVQRNEASVTDFATDKARALLAYLAVERGYPHRRQHLAGLFWPDQPEERARQSLRQALSQLRHALEEKEGSHFLLISPNDVQINPDADVWIDVDAFETQMHDCQDHPHLSLETCLPCLRRQQQAVELYLGEFLAGFSLPSETPFEEWVVLTREGLQIKAMQALTVLADYAEHRGDFASARHYALEQVRFEPWREEAHAHAMRLMAYDGQRSAALAQYLACQRALEKELGLPPAQPTRLLAEQIQNGSLSVPHPVPIPLPAPASFVGREREQAELAEMLANPSSRLITLLGPGGIGKTRLGLQVARNHAGLYRDGIFFISLAAATTCAAALLAIAEKIGLSVTPETDLRQAMCNALQDMQMLILLDNFEQLVQGCEQMSEIFRCATGIKWMITSRERLRLREEWVYPLDGLPVPDSPQAVSLRNEYSQPFAALDLFADRAAQADCRFEITPALLPDVVSICQMVEGLPLGIELAAATIPERSCAEIELSLRQTFDSLQPELRNLPERHSSLRAAFEHSWRLLSPENQEWLARLSVFPAGFTPEAALAVSDTSPKSLIRFAEKSLLRRELDGRYSMHATIRQFATEKLENHQLISEKHAEYFAAFSAEQADQLNGQSAGESLLCLQAERANLQVAWNWTISHLNGLHAASGLLRGLGPLFCLRGPMLEGEQTLSDAFERLEMVESVSPDFMAQLALEHTKLLSAMSEFERAITVAQKAVHFSGRGKDGSLLGRAYLTLAQAFAQQGEFELALDPARQALIVARANSDMVTEANSLRELGNISARQACDEDARNYYEQALLLYRHMGQRRGECAILNNMGLILMNLGQYEQASDVYGKAHQLYVDLGDLRGVAKALNNLSNLAADQGRLDESIQYSEQALAVNEQIGNPRGRSFILHNLGASYLVLGQYKKAEECFLPVLEDYRASGNHQAEAEMLSNLGLLEYQRGNHAAAELHLYIAIEYAEKAGDLSTLSNCLYYLGSAELTQGKLDFAEAHLRRALELRPLERHSARHAELLVELATVLVQRGDYAAALSLTAPLFEVLEQFPGLDGVEDAPYVYWRFYQILAANADSRAESILVAGRDLLLSLANQINDPLLRDSFLTNINSHRVLLNLL